MKLARLITRTILTALVLVVLSSGLLSAQDARPDMEAFNVKFAYWLQVLEQVDEDKAELDKNPVRKMIQFAL